MGQIKYFLDGFPSKSRLTRSCPTARRGECYFQAKSVKIVAVWLEKNNLSKIKYAIFLLSLYRSVRYLQAPFLFFRGSGETYGLGFFFSFLYKM